MTRHASMVSCAESVGPVKRLINCLAVIERLALAKHIAFVLARFNRVDVPSPLATQTSVPSVNRPPSVVEPAPVDITAPKVGTLVRKPRTFLNPMVQYALLLSTGQSLFSPKPLTRYMEVRVATSRIFKIISSVISVGSE